MVISSISPTFLWVEYGHKNRCRGIHNSPSSFLHGLCMRQAASISVLEHLTLILRFWRFRRVIHPRTSNSQLNKLVHYTLLLYRKLPRFNRNKSCNVSQQNNTAREHERMKRFRLVNWRRGDFMAWWSVASEADPGTLCQQLRTQREEPRQRQDC